MTAKKVDKHLLKALTKAYIARAQLFHKGVRASKIDLLIAEIDTIKDRSLDWSLPGLGVTAVAASRVLEAGGQLHQVFAHPEIITQRPHLISYYRNIVTISKKGIGQLLFPTDAYENQRKSEISTRDAKSMCSTFNRIVSGVIESIDDYDVELSRKAVLAEIGTELQGTWANIVGQGASKAVRDLMAEYVEQNERGAPSSKGPIELSNGWRIVFASEPDVAFYDELGTKQIAIEIKGSLDVAGAQTRFGEAKKSFAKQIADNPRCHTVYLASCFTDSVIAQIKQDAQVREWFNLTSILYDEKEKSRFLKRLFHIVDTPI